MIRKFIETPVFRKLWSDYGLNEEDLRILQKTILWNPDSGDVIKGTSGLRKIRVALPGKGKSGGARVLYKDFEFAGTIFFIFLIVKKKQADLTSEQKKMISKIIKEIEADLNRSFHKVAPY